MPLPIYTSAAFTNGSGVSVASNASVEVRRESDGSLVPIFEDRDGENQITQPGFQADLEGRFEFYAEPAAEGWEITVTAGPDTHTLNGQFPQGGVFGIPEGERAINSQELLAVVSEAADVDEAVSFVGRGAIVESGTNANGSFVRWENGEQMCSSEGVTLESTTSATSDSGARLGGAQIWTFPALFVTPPAVSPHMVSKSAGASNGATVITRAGATTESETDIHPISFNNENVTVGSRASAWGFWK